MIGTAEETAFWICLVLLGYVYVGYPLIVFVVSLLFPKPIRKGDIEPTVTILITAYNEELAIRSKLEILVASDGSNDGTEAIVQEFAPRGIKLFRQEGRVGKTVTQNNAVKEASGEIILFSDATTHYDRDVFKWILPAFADETVGCVAGRLVYVDDDSTTVGRGAQSYWSYETFLKLAESQACSLIGASGCLYAVRREAYRPMYPEACSDFLICTMIYRQGMRSVFAPDAVCFEHTNRSASDELKMRVRVISQTFTDLWRNRDMLNPLKAGFFAIELVSHKLLRYVVPVILFALLVSTIFLARNSIFFTTMAAGQSLFYLSAFAGFLMERSGKRLSLLAMPLYFVLANFASLLGFYKFIRGERYAAWEPIRSK